MKIRISRVPDGPLPSESGATINARDAAAIVAMDQQCFDPEDPPLDLRGAWWIARDENGFPVGYAGARVVPHTGNAYLVRAGVLPSARRQGLQRRLIATRLRWAAGLGCPAAVTDTAVSNAASANNLIAQGFRVFWPSYTWAGSCGLYLRKPLGKKS